MKNLFVLLMVVCLSATLNAKRGDVLDSLILPTGTLCNGVGYDGQCLWISDDNGYKIRKVSSTGTFIDSFNQENYVPGVRSAHDISFDMQHNYLIYNVSYGGPINKIALDSNYKKIASIASPITWTHGMDYDGTYLYLRENNGRVYKCNTNSGAVISSFAPPQNSTGAGIVWVDSCFWYSNNLSKKYYQIDVDKAITDGNCNNALIDSFESQRQGGMLAWDGECIWTQGGGNKLYKVEFKETSPSGPGYRFKSVKLNNINADTSDTLLAERGKSVNIELEVYGIKDVYDVRFKAWIDGYVDEIRAASSLFDVEQESTYIKNLTLNLPSDMTIGYYALHLELSDKDNSNELDYVLLVEGIQHLLTIEDVMTSNTELKSGDYFYTIVRVKNIGAQLEKDIRFIVSVPALNISQRTYIDELDTGYATNSGAMLLMIPLTAQPDTYASNVNVIYNGGKDTLNTSFSIIVSPSVGIASLKLPEQHIPSSGIMSDEWYDLSGRAVTKSNQLKPGLYIIKTKQHCSKVLIVR